MQEYRSYACVRLQNRRQLSVFAEETAGCLDSFRTVLFGPPNRRTYHGYGLRDNIMRFLAFLGYSIRQQAAALTTRGASANGIRVTLSQAAAIDAAFSDSRLSFPVYPPIIVPLLHSVC